MYLGTIFVFIVTNNLAHRKSVCHSVTVPSQLTFASAAIVLPSSRTKMSPGTSSRASISCSFPSRITSALRAIPAFNWATMSPACLKGHVSCFLIMNRKIRVAYFSWYQPTPAFRNLEAWLVTVQWYCRPSTEISKQKTSEHQNIGNQKLTHRLEHARDERAQGAHEMRPMPPNVTSFHHPLKDLFGFFDVRLPGINSPSRKGTMDAGLTEYLERPQYQ